MALEEQEARTNLTVLLQPSVKPTLTINEVDFLVGLAMADAVNALPNALYQGWLIKASKAAPGVNVKAGSVSADQAQVYDHCVREADRWAAAAGIPTPTNGLQTTSTTGGGSRVLRSVRVTNG